MGVSPRMSTCQPVYWRWVLCEVCLHFITWLLSWVCRWFIRVHLPKLLFSTFDDQNNLYSAIKRSTQRWTVFFVDNAFHFVLCNFFLFRIRILVSFSYFYKNGLMVRLKILFIFSLKALPIAVRLFLSAVFFFHQGKPSFSLCTLMSSKSSAV